MTRIVGRVVTPDGVLERGCVAIEGDRIASVATAGTDHSGQWIVPGFVDIHVHGGGGFTFTTADPEQAAGAADFHLRHGTTTLLASLVSAPYPLLLDAVRAYTPLVRARTIAGIHLEGPYLSHERCGAQNPAYLRDPSGSELEGLLKEGPDAIRMMTLAPERAGALDAIEWLVRHGVVAAIGHTDATYEQTLAAVEAGATVGTHLYNGMSPPHHRRPGPVFALLASPTVTCELVPDGVHMHDGALRFATTYAGPGRIAFVTDAISAAGMTDGVYELGGQKVIVAGNTAHLARNGSLAGSILTMDAALRRSVDIGLSIVDVCRMLSTTPAAAIGLAGETGALRSGLRADLVVLDEDLNVSRVMRAGRWQ
jgi:N-acetylglucosamine-6-phosphate deacetylase